MKAWIVCLCGVLCVNAGCGAREIRCDGALQPINATATSTRAMRDISDTRSRREE